MYQNESNLISFLKTVVFITFCLLAFSAEANLDSNHDSLRGNVLTTEVQPIAAQAILTPVTDGQTSIHPVNTPDNKGPFSISNKLTCDSRLFNQRFITLRKCRETIISLHRFRYYLPVLPANHDDRPI